LRQPDLAPLGDASPAIASTVWCWQRARRRCTCAIAPATGRGGEPSRWG